MKPTFDKITRTLRLEVQYEGTRYVGWQRQARGKSIQGLLERAVSKVAGEATTLFSSGRTDAGVHALCQVVSFSLAHSRVPPSAFVGGVNKVLPDDIRVLMAEEADRTFLASAGIAEKTYRYFLYVSPQPNVFFHSLSWHLRRDLDWRAVEEATSAIVGTHDFSSFRTRGTPTKTTVRTVSRASWSDSAGGLVYFEITGNGFLKQMVRGLVGTLVEVGQGKRSSKEIPVILSSGDRRKAGANAPPQGLFLWSVTYEL